MELFEQCGWRDTYSGKNQRGWGKRLDRHKKKTPGSSRSQGFYRLLPQLVGSCDPGGVGVSGDAARRGLFNIHTYNFALWFQ